MLGFAAAVAIVTTTVYVRNKKSRRKTTIPIIDISSYLVSNVDNKKKRKEVAKRFDETLSNIGFAMVTGYDAVLSKDCVEEMRSEAKKFFALPLERKNQCHVDSQIGYVARGSENVAASLGKPSSKPDPVESLNLSGYQEKDHEWFAQDTIEKGIAPWHHTDFAKAMPKSLRIASSRYVAGVTAILNALMRISEDALNLPPKFFHKSFEKPGTLLRLAWYPPFLNRESARQRYGEHTDYDGFTILQRESGDTGLQIRMQSGEWQSVPAIENGLTINIGDLLARWTNDRWKATLHRVASPSCDPTQSRLSVVYFTGPHPDTVVKSLVDKTGGAPSKYAPVTAREHVQMKIKASYVDKKKKKKKSV